MLPPNGKPRTTDLRPRFSVAALRGSSEHSPRSNCTGWGTRRSLIAELERGSSPQLVRRVRWYGVKLSEQTLPLEFRHQAIVDEVGRVRRRARLHFGPQHLLDGFLFDVRNSFEMLDPVNAIELGQDLRVLHLGVLAIYLERRLPVCLHPIDSLGI